MGNQLGELCQIDGRVMKCTHKGACTRLWNVLWHDQGGFGEHFKHVLPFQRINHFPGLVSLARKAGLAIKLSRMRRQFPHEYKFAPRSWVLPMELAEFRREFAPNGKANAGRIFILKPDAGAQGRGIFLTRKWTDVERAVTGTGAGEQFVAQDYLAKPLLIDGLKFDLRLYVLVASVSPLRVYLFEDGLVRMCTSAYALSLIHI